MKILFTADWQCDVRNLDRCQKTLDHLLRLIRQHKPYAVVHLGDLKEAFNPVDQRVTNFLVKATEAIISELDIAGHFVIVPGNHDYIYARDGADSCMPALEAAGATVSHVPFKLTWPGVSLWAVPYIRNQDAWKRALQDAYSEAKTYTSIHKLLLFHGEIEGCRRTLHMAGKGPDLSSFVPVFDWCIGGHIHHQHPVSEGVWYCGSPFCNDWGEANERKGFLLLDLKTSHLRVIPSEIPGWYDPEAPEFPIHHAKPDSSKEWDWTGTRVRIHVDVGNDPLAEIAQAVQKAQNLYPGASIHPVPRYTLQNQPDTVDTAGDDTDWIRAYLETLTLPPDVTEDTVLMMLQRFLPTTKTFGIPPLRFQQVSAMNTLNYERAHIHLAHPGLTLLTGVNEDWPGHSNGAGKSNALALPLIALFGKTPKDQKHDSLVRRDLMNGAESGVALEMKLADGRRLNIGRFRKPRPALLVHVDGREVSMGDANATQRQIESLTSLTWEVLTNSLYIGQREIGSVFGTDKERKELFSRLLGLDRFIDAEKLIRARINRVQRLIDGYGEDVNVHTELRSVAASESLRAEEELSDFQLENAKRPKLSALRHVLAATEQSIKNLRTGLKKSEQWMTEDQERFEKALDTSIRVDQQVQTLTAQLEDLSKVKKTCPLCGSDVSVGQLEKHSQELEARIKQLNRTYDRHKKAMDESRRQRAERAKTEVKIRGELEQCITHTATLQAAIEQAQERRNQEQELREKVRQRHETVAYLDRVIARFVTAKTEAIEFRFLLEFCLGVVGRDGLPAYLVERVVAPLNAAALRYSEAFAGSEIQLQFEVSGGDIDVVVQNAHGGRQVIDQSMGEMRMIGLIAAFAFRDVLVPHNLLILDEPGEGLDAENAKSFARGLHTVLERFGSVYLTTHNPFLLSELEPDRHLTVTKRDGIATIQEVQS